MKSKFLILGLVFSLGACQSTMQIPGKPDAAPVAVSTVVSNEVNAMVMSLTLAERLALVYTKLKRCGSVGAGVLCSKQSVVDEIKTADQKAYDLVKKAEKDKGLISLALIAIGDFQKVIP